MAFAKKKVLIVDDDQRLLNLLSQWIQEAGWEVHAIAKPTEAKNYFDQVDVAVVDYMMPEMDGVSLIETLPSHIPALMLTAVDELPKKIDALNRGADDYLTKPFEPTELIARLNALFRRKHAKNIHQTLTWQNYSLDIEHGLLQHNGLQVDLSSTEMLFLKTLGQQPFQAVARSELAKRAGHFVSERAVDVQINRLRKKINDSDGRILQTIRHIGYALFPEEVK